MLTPQTPVPAPETHRPKSPAVYRFIASFVALAAGAAIIVYVPDPGLKIIGSGIAGAAALSIEKFLNTGKDE